jgi:hypothetical protein
VMRPFKWLACQSGQAGSGLDVKRKLGAATWFFEKDVLIRTMRQA